MIKPAQFKVEQQFWKSGLGTIAGIDEVGRGAWAGPVVAAAVVFPKNINFPDKLFDSKVLNPQRRENLARLIYSQAKAVGLGVVSVEVINKVGIGQATHKAFRQALKNLNLSPDHVLVDSFYIKHFPRGSQTPLAKGDSICASIAAASIVAKVYRDSIMRKLSRKYPLYGWGTNKGYGTASHQEAIRANQFTTHHRKSFNLAYLIQ